MFLVCRIIILSTDQIWLSTCQLLFEKLEKKKSSTLYFFERYI